MTPSPPPDEPLDVIIVGAGLSGVGAAHHLSRRCPEKRVLILEQRGAIGGTWDLFRYPGIRSDSDMFTLGYPFRPWTSERGIADGTSIREYIQATAREEGIEERVRFHHHVSGASFSSETGLWTLDVTRTDTGEELTYRCRFLFMCAGYYRYESGYDPPFTGRERFPGPVVHPQKWPEGLDYAGKRVVVIGSGATAVTLVPAMAGSAAHVTMLQRSPSYVVSVPSADPLARRAFARLPPRVAYGVTRARNLAFGQVLFHFCRRFPKQARALILKGVRQQLPGYDVDTHFNPRYAPWDQRLCLVPDGDLFRAIRKGRADVVTDHIETFTERGILLRSGRELEADVIVTATGLVLQFLGNLRFRVDGELLKASELMTYKGLMLSDVPNLALALGYTNASWTLKSDLTCRFVCRLLRHMDDKGVQIAVPRRSPNVRVEPMMPLSSGYFQRAQGVLPQQGSRPPWKLFQNYPLDLLWLGFLPVADKSLELRVAGRGTSVGAKVRGSRRAGAAV